MTGPPPTVDPARTLIGVLRSVLGDAVLLHLADCMRTAEESTRRLNGYEPARHLAPGRALIAAAATQIRAERSGRHLPQRPVAEGAEVPRAVDRQGWNRTEYVTVEEAAEMLGCSTRNVRDLATRETIPSRRQGRRWLVERNAVQARAAAARGQA